MDTRQFSKVILLEETSETSANTSVGDLDGDCDLDIVLAKGRHWPLHDRVLLNDGSGIFSDAKNLGDQPDRTYSAVLVDLDQDDDLDVVVSNDSPDKKLIYINDGQAVFRVAGTWGSPQWNTRNASVADLNGDMNRDGASDIVIGYATAPGSVFFNKGQGVDFQQVRFGDGKGVVYGIAQGDLNKDGFLDIAVGISDAPNKVYLSGL